MNKLELKIPPPVVALLVAVAMWLARNATGALSFVLADRLAIAIALAVLGGAVAVAGIVSFRRAGTTSNPMRPEATSSLVATGIYRFTRNPMYLGSALVLFGWAVYLSNVAAFAGPLLFVLYIDRFQIVPEERMLATKFGTAFDDYRRRTRRWI